eukprot:GHVH01004543.1.p1 GENE.GHVH01004543.1~~GHVH01004543.1.p1  ORF type:complete len:510 (-),score=110.25 GHVH01004543.1:22-1551(-)
MASFLSDLLGSLGNETNDALELTERVNSRIVEDRQGTTVEAKMIEDNMKKKRSALQMSKKTSHAWTSQLRRIATTDQVTFESSSRSDRANDVRIDVGHYTLENEGGDLLTALTSSGVVQDRCVSLKSLTPCEKMVEKKKEQAAAREKSRLIVLMQREQAKSAWHNRQKGKGNRRKLKKRMEKDQKKLIETLEKSNPEIISKMRSDYEDQRAAIRMMPNHAKRKKWARIATRFGNSDAVSNDAARTFEKKRETDEVLHKFSEEEDEEDVSDESDSGNSQESDGSDDSDSDVSCESGSGRLQESHGSDRIDSDSDRPVKKSKKSHVPVVQDIDLTAYTNDALGEQNVANISDMFTGSGASNRDEALHSIAERQRELDGEGEESEEELVGWGTGWAGDNYSAKLELKEKVREDRLQAELKEKKKKPIFINRKLSQKFAKYFTTTVPAGYRSEAEYKVKMSQPIGPDWNTELDVRSKTKPKVFVEKGTVIQPIGESVIVLGNRRKTELKGLDR